MEQTQIDYNNTIQQKLKQALQFHIETRGYYFWRPSLSASGRRSNEIKRNKQAVDIVIETYLRKELKTKVKYIHLRIEIYQNYAESCRNVYVSSIFKINNIKTNSKKIEGLLNETFCIYSDSLKETKKVEIIKK